MYDSWTNDSYKLVLFSASNTQHSQFSPTPIWTVQRPLCTLTAIQKLVAFAGYSSMQKFHVIWPLVQTSTQSWQSRSELIPACLDCFFFPWGQGPSQLLWPVLQAYRDMVSFSRSGTDPAGPTAGSNFYLMWTSRVGFQHQLNIWSSLQAGAGTDGACWLVMLDRLVGARR